MNMADAGEPPVLGTDIEPTTMTAIMRGVGTAMMGGRVTTVAPPTGATMEEAPASDLVSELAAGNKRATL